MRIYTPSGEPYDGEPVDCRELMQQHGYTAEPPVGSAEQATAEPVAQGAAVASAFADMKYVELKSLCETSGIAVPGNASKAQLVDLLEQATGAPVAQGA